MSVTRRAFVAAIALVAAASALAPGALLSAGRAARGGSAASGPCASAIAKRTLCQPANDFVVRLLAARKLDGLVMMQSVKTGAALVVAGTANAPGGGHPSAISRAPLLPLSTVKLMTAASWLDHEKNEDSRAGKATADTLSKMLVDGLDDPGRLLALDLRRAVGSEAVLDDLTRFGFPRCAKSVPSTPDSPRPCVALSAKTIDADWASALSIGEANLTVSLAQLSGFLRAIGNGWKPILSAAPSSRRKPGQMVSAATAIALQRLMLQTVETGTAKGIRGRLGAQWKLGGKTGTGPAQEQPYDGVFAGLVFDENSVAQYTAICYVQHGGPGGGPPAEIAADTAKFILGL